MGRPDGEPVRGMTQEEAVAAVRRVVAEVAGPEASGSLVVETFRGQACVRLPAGSWRRLFAALRDDPGLRFDMALDVTCAHHPGRPLPDGDFDVVYHLLSVSRGHRLRLKVACPDPEEGVESVAPVWPGADWMEREAFDMFGVRFRGHPDLRRILMPDGFDGWPLRKDFPWRGH